MSIRLTLALTTAAALVACGTAPIVTAPATNTALSAWQADPAAACAKLAGGTIEAGLVSGGIGGLASGAARIDTAKWHAASSMTVATGGPTPAARITPAMPAHCRVLGRIAPVDPSAPPILFQVNLPDKWNGRSLQYGGGGFNGVLINALGLLPAARYDEPAPLAQGYVTVGTDSGHQNAPGVPPQAFALNEEALVNFAHAAYPKVSNVALQIVRRAYGRSPAKLYFVGSSEGGREALTMAQRYPWAFDGIIARVPVIHWTGLQYVGVRDSVASMGAGWINPAQTQLVHRHVLKTCDALDGLADGIVSYPVACKRRLHLEALRCAGAAADDCLTEPQINAIRTQHSPYRFDFDLANGLREYPGRGPSGEGAPANGPTGGWGAWWLGSEPPSAPPTPRQGIAWQYGGGALQYFYAQDAKADPTQLSPNQHRARVQAVSALMDSTNPDLSAFKARGGKLIVLENMADYAQSPYAGIQYVESVKQRMGQGVTAEFLRLYTAPGVDHVGAGAPGSANLLGALVDWVEHGKAPQNLTLVEQTVAAQPQVIRARPLCEWPLWPRYQGGDVNAASSFVCTSGRVPTYVNLIP